MMVIYHGRRPYLPLLACALHLGLDREAEPFLPHGLNHDWRTSPLYIAGQDGTGAMVFCLAHGRYYHLYRRALSGMAGIFGLSVIWADLDQAATTAGLALRLRMKLTELLPGLFERRQRPAIAATVRSYLITC